ncbi:MAG TPA: methyltransferase domain-containing protein [Thermoanaerobaculia bacterium]|jgi:SAM-dependent methyltransferase
MNRDAVARALGSRYATPYLRNYVRWKVAMDPVYEGVAERLREHHLPLVDVGCGVGLMVFYLRESGFDGPIVGIDFDEGKIAAANEMASRYEHTEFRTGDARAPLPEGHSVLILDVLQYFETAGQQVTLRNAARVVPEGGVVIIRSGVRDKSWRYRLSWLSDTFGRAIRWMQAERLVIPTREEIEGAFAEGFEKEVVPLWGRTPFNNYLFIFRRAARRSE